MSIFNLTRWIVGGLLILLGAVWHFRIQGNKARLEKIWGFLIHAGMVILGLLGTSLIVIEKGTAGGVGIIVRDVRIHFEFGNIKVVLVWSLITAVLIFFFRRNQKKISSLKTVIHIMYIWNLLTTKLSEGTNLQVLKEEMEKQFKISFTDGEIKEYCYMLKQEVGAPIDIKEGQAYG